MKKISLLIAISFILFASSCDPDNKDIFNPETVRINGNISDTNEVIRLGDTLKLRLILPDTVVSNGRSYVVQSMQKAQFYMRIFKVDTVNRKASSVDRSLYWVNKGSVSSTNQFNYLFSNQSKPYTLALGFKPIKKGIYYFEVVSQPGDLKINNSFEARLVVSFDVPDKHIYLAESFLGVDWANASRITEFGTYVFRAN